MKLISLLSALLSLSAVADDTLTLQQAADRLYTTLSLPDKPDYSREYYTENVRLSLRACREMAWSKTFRDEMSFLKRNHAVLLKKDNKTFTIIQ